MPGVIEMDPYKSYMGTPGASDQAYKDATGKGFKYVGGVNPWEWQGTQSTNPGAKGYVLRVGKVTHETIRPEAVANDGSAVHDGVGVPEAVGGLASLARTHRLEGQAMPRG